jgi:hypothetical protein
VKPPTHHLSGVRLEREIERSVRDFVVAVRKLHANETHNH